jgi:broad specificity phosphatase PhoE
MKIYVIRHGLSDGNAAGVIQGHSDSALSLLGSMQANLLGRFLRREGVAPEIIYSSPLQRASETAETISRALYPIPPIEKVPDFMEVDVGTLSGLSLEEAHSKYPEEFAPDVNMWLDFSPFGGESFDRFFRRVETATRSIISRWGDLLADRTFMFVTHAGVMRPLLKTLLDTRSDMMFFTFGNCCLARLEYRNVRGLPRKVMVDVLQIDRVASLMGEELPLEHGDRVDPKT